LPEGGTARCRAAQTPRKPTKRAVQTTERGDGLEGIGAVAHQVAEGIQRLDATEDIDGWALGGEATEEVFEEAHAIIVL
jgi:hypothetical protein